MHVNDQPCKSVGESKREVERDEAAIGVADENEFIEAERGGQGIAIRTQALQRDFAEVCRPIRLAVSQMIVIDDLCGIGQWIDERTEILVVEPKAAVHENDGHATAKRRIVELMPVRRRKAGRLRDRGRREIALTGVEYVAAAAAPVDRNPRRVIFMIRTSIKGWTI